MNKSKLLLVFCLTLTITTGCKKDVVKPNLQQIKNISNLATVESYYHNVAKAEIKAGDGITHIGEKDRKYWIEYTGVARIGIDINKVNLEIEGKKIIITIPTAEILSVDILDDKENKIKHYSTEDGLINKNKVTAKRQQEIIDDAQEEMKETILKNQALFVQAEDKAKKILENYIQNLSKYSRADYEIEFRNK